MKPISGYTDLYAAEPDRYYSLFIGSHFLERLLGRHQPRRLHPGWRRPSATEINAAAEQAATENPASLIPIETKTAGSALPSPTAAPVTESTSGANPQINRRVNVPENLRVNWLLHWDAIRPVYDPKFASAEDAPLDDEELVIGLSLEGEAKAYPITVLRFREMVNDEMAGIPTLVTW